MKAKQRTIYSSFAFSAYKTKAPHSCWTTIPTELAARSPRAVCVDVWPIASARAAHHPAHGLCAIMLLGHPYYIYVYAVRAVLTLLPFRQRAISRKSIRHRGPTFDTTYLIPFIIFASLSAATAVAAATASNSISSNAAFCVDSILYSWADAIKWFVYRKIWINWMRWICAEIRGQDIVFRLGISPVI